MSEELSVAPRKQRGWLHRIKHFFDPRREPLWLFLLVLGAAFRVWNVLGYRNPMDLVFSDASRHLDNARHFLEPGPMGASNPYLYQLFLWLAVKVTHENKVGMGAVAAGLSVAYPLCWYLFASRVVQRRVTALRYTTLISFLPTHVAMFSFFMNETLLLPLLGAAFWATVVAGQRRSWRFFVLASALWVMAVLTRSVVLPIGAIAMLWAYWRQPRKVVTAVAGLALVCIGFGTAAKRAYPMLHRYTPFGDNSNVAIYFVSAAHDYKVTYTGDRGTYFYFYSSPSLYVSPFEPFYDFKSARTGQVEFTIDVTKQGADLRETFSKELAAHRSMLPRMIAENLLFLSFSHSWPDSAREGVPGQICLWERWIWFPIILFTFFGSIVAMRRRGWALLPMLTVLFTLCLYGSQATIMEGRYRKPLEPLLMLTVFWLAGGQMSRPRKDPST
jgi:hypothetical protein